MTDALSSLEGIEAASAQADQALDATPAVDNNKPIIAPNEATVAGEPSWNYDDGIPGQGDKPDWYFADKYKSITEQAKAYPEALKMMGDFHGSPKDGYSLEKYKDQLDQGSPFLKEIMDKANTMNMSQGGLETVLDLFVNYEKANTPDPEKFVKSLTPEQHSQAQKVIGWAQNNFSEDEFNVVANWMSDPMSLGILAKMRGMDRETKMPRMENSGPIPKVMDVQSTIFNNYDKYKEDEAYRARLDKQMEEALAREGKI